MVEASQAIPCGEALLQLFTMQEIDCIFCSPLSVWAPLWEALAKKQYTNKDQKPKPFYVNCRHEVLAVGAAAGYYKTTGNMQVVLLPTALGVLNAAMAIRGAYQERIPMLILAPDSLTFGEQQDRDPGAEWPPLLGDLGGPTAIAQGIVKWRKEVKTSRELAFTFQRACYFAESVPRGPVLVSIPFDLLLDNIVLESSTKVVHHPVVASAQTINEVAERLVNSLDPLIITDHAGRSLQARTSLTSLAELLGAPVCEFWMPTYQSIDRTHPLYCKEPVEKALQNADGATVIIIEEDPLRPRAAYWGYQSDYCVAGDIGENLECILKAVKHRLEKAPYADAARRSAERRHRWETYDIKGERVIPEQTAEGGEGEAVQPSELFTMLDTLLPEDAIIVDEIIAQLPDMLKVLFQKHPYRHYRGTAGGLGTGIPTALGVKIAERDSLVVCIIGDGSFHYNPVPACFGLCRQYNVPILVIICNNQGFASQAWNIGRYYPQGQAMQSENFFGSVIEPTPDYSGIAAAYGGHGTRVTDRTQLKSSLKQAINAVSEGTFAVVDILLTS